MTWQKEWKAITTSDAWGKTVDKVKSTIGVDRAWLENGAVIVGDLALDFTDEGWNIYHVPTGACFDSAVPPAIPGVSHDDSCYQFSKEQLLAWMAKVQQSNPTAWTMLRLLKPDTYATEGASAKKIIKEWCLSVKVE